ncbi:IclR family transcriptional regulator domain-containing protein [Leisingera sp. ANG-Vp]|uniref:IclR family transcriptional regulator domain-containing protein n=1 Tax=Leisingera sp. ANG-Vp TaxID=1577896 RepID=UPI000580799A|nr:IclR family transcriptional regulator C-terminal domain-containing protein [Leisingera sp. ANG-Vp]KIC20740.1 IclR family transcriptional regulator [Leisingera sp. ANG-Vp]
MMNKSTDFVASLAKGLRVIEAFHAEKPRLSITDVAQETGLDRATARRCLLTLAELGYADYDGKFFSLTPRILRLGVAALASMPLPQIVQPWLDQLSERVGQSCSVAILEGTEILYVARAAQRRVMSIGLMPGSRLPAFCTSMGRVLLAALPRDGARKIIEQSDLSPRTPNSLTGVSELMQELDHVRLQGYALVDQEVELGLRSLSVPILNQRGDTVAALNIGLAALQPGAASVVSDYLEDLLRVQAGLKRVFG